MKTDTSLIRKVRVFTSRGIKQRQERDRETAHRELYRKRQNRPTGVARRIFRREFIPEIKKAAAAGGRSRTLYHDLEKYISGARASQIQQAIGRLLIAAKFTINASTCEFQPETWCEGLDERGAYRIGGCYQIAIKISW